MIGGSATSGSIADSARATNRAPAGPNDTGPKRMRPKMLPTPMQKNRVSNGLSTNHCISAPGVRSGQGRPDSIGDTGSARPLHAQSAVRRHQSAASSCGRSRPLVAVAEYVSESGRQLLQCELCPRGLIDDLVFQQSRSGADWVGSSRRPAHICRSTTHRAPRSEQRCAYIPLDHNGIRGVRDCRSVIRPRLWVVHHHLFVDALHHPSTDIRHPIPSQRPLLTFRREMNLSVGAVSCRQLPSGRLFGYLARRPGNRATTARCPRGRAGTRRVQVVDARGWRCQNGEK